MSEKKPKVGFFTNDGIIAFSCFDTPKDELYRNWRLSKSIANELVASWTMLKKDKHLIVYPGLECKNLGRISILSEIRVALLGHKKGKIVRMKKLMVNNARC